MNTTRTLRRAERQYVQSGGAWHLVERVVAPANMRIFVAACGEFFPEESVVSARDVELRDSKIFCAKCLAIRQEKPVR